LTGRRDGENGDRAGDALEVDRSPWRAAEVSLRQRHGHGFADQHFARLRSIAQARGKVDGPAEDVAFPRDD